MPARPFHLCWFTDGYRVPAWNTRWEGSTSETWASDPGFYVDLARSLERAKFDFLMFSDSAYVADAYGGTPEAYLKHGNNAPKHDPSVLVPIIASQTSRLGIVPTLSTTEWRPFQLSRYMATLDHVSGGRAGWNIVTSSSDHAAQNYGFDNQPGHDERYDMADEFVEIVTRLWDSWDPDAVTADRERGCYVDYKKVHTIDYEGKYFRSRGPATTICPPQGRPVLVQAGNSQRGREFAAQHAEVVLGSGLSPEGLRNYRLDVLARARASGREADSLRFFIICDPILADTDELARERALLYDAESEAKFELNLTTMSRHWAVDLAKCDVDAPLPADLTTNGHAGMLAEAIASGKTLRQLYGGVSRSGEELGLVGSPETVASQLAEMLAEVGGDGVMFLRSHVDRRYIAEIADGLIPVLQRRGLTRTEYSGQTLRDHLLEF